MTFEAFQIKASFELEPSREGEKGKSSEGTKCCHWVTVEATHCRFWKYTNQYQVTTEHAGFPEPYHLSRNWAVHFHILLPVFFPMEQ